MVNFQVLEQIAKQYGLTLEMRMNFHEYYDHCLDPNQNKASKFNQNLF